MANEGHQIASHTWSHQNASAISNTQLTNQMVWNEIAFNSVLGFFPAYMRPPFSICDRTCQSLLSTLGYHVIYFDLDTEGYLHDDPKQIQTSKNIWDQTISKSNPSKDSYLQIEHDIHYQTVYNLTDYILTSLFSHGYKSVTVGECLNDPKENWYRTGPGGGTVPRARPPPPSQLRGRRATQRATPRATQPQPRPTQPALSEFLRTAGAATASPVLGRASANAAHSTDSAAPVMTTAFPIAAVRLSLVNAQEPTDSSPHLPRPHRAAQVRLMIYDPVFLPFPTYSQPLTTSGLENSSG